MGFEVFIWGAGGIEGVLGSGFETGGEALRFKSKLKVGLLLYPQFPPPVVLRDVCASL